MSRRHDDQYDRILEAFARYQEEVERLPGLQPVGSLETLTRQIIASLRRVEYASVLQTRNHSERRLDPHDRMFDPITAAHLNHVAGRRDEAVWSVLFATQFGKHSVDGWQLCANIQGSFGRGPVWTAEEYRGNPLGFSRMLHRNTENLSDPDIAGRYSNHRQYVSRSPENIERTFAEASAWLFEFGTFDEKVRETHRRRGQDPVEVFDDLYKSMRSVHSFGRLGTFDFLTMLGKLGLAPVVPGSTYLVGATGPLRGARLLFFGDTANSTTARALQGRFDQLDDYLQIGKQPLEDSICNWQKSPQSFVHFRG